MVRTSVRALAAVAVMIVAAGCLVRPPKPPPPIPAEVVSRVSAAVVGTWQGHLETAIVDDLTLVFTADGKVTATSPLHDATGTWRVTGDPTFSLDLRAPARPPAWPIEGTVSVSLHARLDAAGDRFTSSGGGTLTPAPGALPTTSTPIQQGSLILVPGSFSAPATMTAVRQG